MAVRLLLAVCGTAATAQARVPPTGDRIQAHGFDLSDVRLLDSSGSHTEPFFSPASAQVGGSCPALFGLMRSTACSMSIVLIITGLTGVWFFSTRPCSSDATCIAFRLTRASSWECCGWMMTVASVHGACRTTPACMLMQHGPSHVEFSGAQHKPQFSGASAAQAQAADCCTRKCESIEHVCTLMSASISSCWENCVGGAWWLCSISMQCSGSTCCMP